MSQIQIPKNWEIKKIGEITKSYSGGTPSTHVKDYWENGIIPWIRSGELEDNIIENVNSFITKKGLENSSAKLYPPNTVLVAITGATTAKTALLKIEACGTQNVFGILPCEELLPKYLWYYMRYSYSNLVSKSFGGAQPHINGQIIKNLDITYPHLKIQEKIVQKLDYILGQLEEKKKVILELQRKKIKQVSKLHSNLFIDAIGKILHIKNPLGSWRISSLGQISSIVGGGTLKGVDEGKGEQIHLIKVSDMNLEDNQIYITKPNLVIYTSDKTIIKKAVPECSIIFPKRGGAILTNKKRITTRKSLLDPNIMGLIPNKKIEPLFLYYWMLTFDLGKFVGSEVIPQLNKYDIEPVEISYPEELEEQQKLVKKINELKIKIENMTNRFYTIIKINQNQTSQIEHVHYAILEKAFSGKLVN